MPRWTTALLVLTTLVSVATLVLTSLSSADRDARIAALEAEVRALGGDEGLPDEAAAPADSRAHAALSGADLEAIAQVCAVAVQAAPVPNVEDAPAIADPTVAARQAATRERASDLLERAAASGRWSVADRDGLRALMEGLSQPDLGASMAELSRMINEQEIVSEVFPPI